MNYQEYNITMTYMRGDVVWFGELAYTAKDFVINECPDESNLWKVYTRTITR